MLGVVMAGGKSSRYGREKLLETIHGKKVIDIVVENLSLSIVKRFFIAVSWNAPRTLDYCKRYDSIITPGISYPDDVKFLLEKFSRPLLIINGDAVFVDPKTINLFASSYHGKSMTALVNSSGRKVYIGLNMAVPGDERDEVVEFKNHILSLNINTPEDLRRAETIAYKW
ncbi:MAG: NTP transferase domain-containing protein [Thermoplasmatales archaeon]|nr:NTP transferase domain-containing protein [Thermoplasmatales archaeon]